MIIKPLTLGSIFFILLINQLPLYVLNQLYELYCQDSYKTFVLYHSDRV